MVRPRAQLSGASVSPPLHSTLQAHLNPWKDREIWLEASLTQDCVTVTRDGAKFCPQFPVETREGGFYDDTLCCHYHTCVAPEQITFTLFDTPESLAKKLDEAAVLGVKRAVGLYQELGAFLTGKESA